MFQIRLALLWLLPVLGGCAIARGTPPPEPPRDPLSLALVEMDQERFRTAQLHLREAASACPGTGSAADALLLLSALHLDPRFEGRDPEAAARYAARVVWRSGVPAPDVEVARALYLAALELGAPPLGGRGDTEPDVGASDGPVAASGVMAQQGPPPVAAPAWNRSAPAGADPQDAPADGLPVPPCPGIDGIRTWEPLPEHPGPVLAQSIVQARAALDSLAAPAPGVQDEDSSEVERLRARVEQLEAELTRIRRLLRGGG